MPQPLSHGSCPRPSREFRPSTRWRDMSSRVGAGLAATAFLAGAASATGQVDPLPEGLPPSIEAPAPAETESVVIADHPIAATGWARSISADVALEPEPSAVGFSSLAVPGTKVAAEVIEVRQDLAGAAWAFLVYPSGATGWAPVDQLRTSPPPVIPSPSLTAALDRYLGKIPGRIGMVVRDEYGRPFYEFGTDRPLVLASVTKLFTVGAALEQGPIGSRAGQILKPSNNYLAQRLIEKVGGSNARGTRAAEEHASQYGSDVQLADGSGLSPQNRASANEVVDYLVGVRERSWFHQLRRALPLAGRTGTLESRLIDTKAERRVRAKTGTLFTPSVSTLAGYAWPVKSGGGPNRVLTFAILLNGYDYTRGRTVQDRVLRMIVSRTR